MKRTNRRARLAIRAIGRCIVGVALAMPALAADPKPGLWEYQIEMQLPGMRMPAQTVRHCLTAKDLAERKQFTGEAKNNNCTVSNFKEMGNQVSYDVACDTQMGKMTGSSTGTTMPDGIRLETKMNIAGGPAAMSEMTQVVTGRRVGDCKG